MCTPRDQGDRLRRCALWTAPEATIAAGMKNRFVLVDTFVDESHVWRYLLACRECGQRYFYEFYEEIDWQDGDDPQFMVWVPVETQTEIDRLLKIQPGWISGVVPRLCVDRPKGQAQSSIYWVTLPSPH